MNTSKRIAIVLWKLTPLIASFIRDYRRYIFWGSGRALSKDQHLARAKALTVTLEYLGPTFIKLAQVLSARADVLPPTYIKELSALQDKVNPTPTAVIAALIREELRRPIEAVFERFDDAPLAAAIDARQVLHLVQRRAHGVHPPSSTVGRRVPGSTRSRRAAATSPA